MGQIQHRLAGERGVRRDEQLGEWQGRQEPRQQMTEVSTMLSPAGSTFPSS